MSAMTIRNLPEEIHRALKVRARRHGRSTEAEVRAILTEAVVTPDRMKLGSLLHEIGAPLGGVDLDIDRGSEPNEPPELT